MRTKYKNNTNVSGEIEIISERVFFDNCDYIVDLFEKEFPNIKVTCVELWSLQKVKRDVNYEFFK